ncbi:MAG TPA: hypothetical protein VND93_06530 [Myxococcales bacterium]|nr:hypothetical protein [Myxococcales bacterium]
MRRALLLAAALSLAAPGCSRCGSAGPAPELARVLPRDAEALVLVPDLGALGERLKRLEQLKLASFVAQLQGAASAQELVASAMFQLGADLRSRESMEKAGLDPSRGAAAVWLAGGGTYAVAAVKEEKAFRETVRRLARDRLGATAASEAGRVTAFSRAPGGPPQLSLLFQDGWAFVAPGATGARLPELAAVAEGAALSTQPEYRSGLAALPRERQVLVRLPATSTLARRGAAGGALLSLALGPEALVVSSVLPSPGAGSGSGAEKAVALLRAAGPAPDLLGLAAPDAFLLARSSGSPEGLGPVWSQLAGRWAESVKQGGFDLDAEVLGNLKPGSVLSVSLAPTVNLATGVPELDVRRTNPFGYVHLVAAGEVKDAAKAAHTLEIIPPVAQRLGATITPSTREGQRVYLTRYAQGEGAHLALVGDKVVMASPVSRLDEAIGRAKAGKRAEGLAADPAFRPLLDAHPLAVAVDLRRLAESVRALPSSAWGLGGFAMKATALRWLDATSDLRAVTFWAAVEDGAVRSELQLRFQSPAPQGPPR